MAKPRIFPESQKAEMASKGIQSSLDSHYGHRVRSMYASHDCSLLSWPNDLNFTGQGKRRKEQEASIRHHIVRVVSHYPTTRDRK